MAFPVTIERLESVERELGRRLPSDLRDRLLRNNGGDVEAAGGDWRLFPVFDDSDRRRVARTTGHLVHETHEASQWRGFPLGAIAIGADGTGNYLVLLPDDERVFLWEHVEGTLAAVDVNW